MKLSQKIINLSLFLSVVTLLVLLFVNKSSEKKVLVNGSTSNQIAASML